MDIIISILAFLVLICIVVSIHEGGHFITARLCGMKVLEFSIGLGPVILSRAFGKDKTIFTLRLLPLGGFVKPLDKSTVEEAVWKNLPDNEKSRSFNNSATWKKALMVAGGPFANFVLTFIVSVVAFNIVGSHSPQPIVSEVIPQSVASEGHLASGDIILKINNTQTKTLDDAYSALMDAIIQSKITTIVTNQGQFTIDYSKTDANKINGDFASAMGFYFKGIEGDLLVEDVDMNSPGALAGLKSGDIIKQFNHQPIHDVSKIIRLIQMNPNQKIILSVETSNHKTKELIAIPKTQTENGRIIGKIGVLFKTINNKPLPLVKYSLIQSIDKSYNKVVQSSYTTLVSIKKMITGQLSAKSMSGPIAIASYSGQSALAGLYAYLMMIGTISIAIGIFNLLPIPMLDGGHLLQYAIEAIIRKPISPKIIFQSQRIGFSILAGVFFMSLINDVSKWFI